MTDTTMSCERVDALLAGYLDEEAPASERRAVELHLATCLRCAALVRDLERIRARAGALAPLAPPRDLWPEVGARLDAADA
jgi:anti-sigma factor RsiW